MLLSVSTGRIDASTLRNHFPRQGSPEKQILELFFSRVLPFVRLLFPLIFANARKIGTRWTGDLIEPPLFFDHSPLRKRYRTVTLTYTRITVERHYGELRGKSLWKQHHYPSIDTQIFHSTGTNYSHWGKPCLGRFNRDHSYKLKDNRSRQTQLRTVTVRVTFQSNQWTAY